MVGWLAGWLGGWFLVIIIPLCGPSCKLRLARSSARLRFQDGAECGNNWQCGFKRYGSDVLCCYLYKNIVLFTLLCFILYSFLPSDIFVEVSPLNPLQYGTWHVWVGLINFRLEFGKDPTNGCWDIPLFIFEGVFCLRPSFKGGCLN